MKKFLSVLLIVSLLILPIKTFAATDAPPSEISDAPLDVVSENEDMGTRAATDGIISGYIYNIKNVNSGKYLNVHNGVDADGTNIYQWTKDGSTEQNFKVIYCPSTDSYTFYAMCSSNGNFRVVNIHLQRGVELLSGGQNVNLWDPDAAYTQQFIIVPLGENQYRIACRNDIWLFLAANGTSNGSSGGTSPTSSGNVYLSEYVASMTQHWVFEPVGPAPEAEPRGYIENVDSTGITGWVWSNGLPDTSLNIHIYIEDGLGAQYFYVTTANIYRQDLYNCGYGNGYHGFFFPVNWKEFIPKPYTITIFAIGGSNPPLVNAPWSFTVRQCQGAVTEITSTQINGWVYRPDAPNYSIDTHIYIRNAAGQDLAILPATANIYRADLAGYGTGNYGFSINVNWSTFPEEQLYLTAYALDGTGFNTTYWTGIYDNRRPINIIGMIDDEGMKFNTAYNTVNVTTWCQNIGCTAVNKFNGAQKNAIINRIKEASFCVVDSHGLKDTIFCYLNGVAQANDLKSSDIYALSDGYFNGTRCVLVAACECGQGGAGSPENIVNRLHQKGVETVVGFQTKIGFLPISEDPTHEDYGKMNNTCGYPLWGRTFIKELGNGSTVQNACNLALNAVKEKHGNEDLWGLDSVYIAGNANQIVKH